MNLEGVRPVRRRSRRHLGQTIGNYRQRMHQQRQTTHLHRCLYSRIYPLSRCRMFQDMSQVDSLQDYLQTHRHHRRNAACRLQGMHPHPGLYSTKSQGLSNLSLIHI